MGNKRLPPVWRKWKQIPEWKVWEAVALSMNIDPDTVERNKDAWMHDGRYPPFKESRKEFWDRLEIAQRNLSHKGGLQARVIIMGEWWNATIVPVEFAAWAKRSEWDLPAELLSLSASQSNSRATAVEKAGVVADARTDDSSTAPSGAWPWGRHETHLLKALAAAATKFWVNYDPADPTTAPERAAVIDYLERKHGVSERVAKYIAQILRADGLRPGTRTGNTRKN